MKSSHVLEVAAMLSIGLTSCNMPRGQSVEQDLAATITAQAAALEGTRSASSNAATASAGPAQLAVSSTRTA